MLDSRNYFLFYMHFEHFINSRVQATDGIHNATCRVEITVRDVNNHAPVFDSDKYDADVSEDAPIGECLYEDNCGQQTKET